jgi:hypothetical protein
MGVPSFDVPLQIQLQLDGDVLLREIIIAACKPGHRPKMLSHSDRCLGRFAQVADDFDNILRRSKPTTLNIHDWQFLSKDSVANHFVFLPRTTSPQPLMRRTTSRRRTRPGPLKAESSFV